MAATTRRTRPTSTRRIRRNRITERDAAFIGSIAVLSAIGGAAAGAGPTAWQPADVILTGLLAAFVAWTGASAPWWVLAAAAAIATLVAPTALWVGASLTGFVLALVIGVHRSSMAIGRALVAAVAINVLLRWEDPGWFGRSALVTGGVVAAIALTGLARRGRVTRRAIRRAALVLVGLAGLAVVGAAIAIALAAADLRDGERSLRAAASALRAGDVEGAVTQLERGSEQLASASNALQRPWARPALAVPFLGQHVDALSELASEAESLTVQAATSVAQIDVESLRVVGGVIDLAAIEVLATPFADTNESLQRLATVVDDVRSPWLIAPLGDRLAELAVEVDDLVEQTDRALDAVRLAPSMLGSDEPRAYFVAFTTPAEARGLGGYMGTWAELRAEQGRLKVTAAGLTIDLIGRMGGGSVILDGPPDYLARYGRFGAGVGGEPVAIDFWSNYTMSPDFPSVTEVIAQLYPQSGGKDIDGAIAVDVDAVARFLELTGPIAIDGPAGLLQLDSSNARDYLLRDQYATIIDDAVRDAVLEQLTTELITSVFGGTLPGPRILAETLGPAMADGRLVVWSLHADDQPLLRELGISGALPAPSPDGLAVTGTNAGANKLDAYLRRSITYEAVVNEASGELLATATIRLANDAPNDLPEDVGGNPFGLPPGTNRHYLSVYSPWQVRGAELDGQPRGIEVERELGWNVYSMFLDIPPGEEVEMRIALGGTLPEGADYGLTLRSQPMAVPDTARIDVRSTEGRLLLASHDQQVGVEQFAPGSQQR